MTTAEKISTGCLVAILCLAGAEALREREARITVEATIAARTDAQRERKEALDEATAPLLKQLATLKTAPQAAHVIRQYIAAPPTGGVAAGKDEPVTVVTQGDLKGSKAYDELPNAPDATLRVILTDAQAQSIAKQQIACDVTQKGLTACTADLADEKVKTQAAVTALKGGTFMQRLWRAAKPIGCAAGGAALGSYFKGAAGAAVGAAASGAACAIAF